MGKKIMKNKIDIIPGEIWKDIESYEGLYQISSLGRIKSMPRTFKHTRQKRITIREGHILLPKLTKYGYHRVELSNKSIRKIYHVHRVVGKAFIDNPENKPFINHIDCNPLNNNFSNLEWCTQKENIAYAWKLGRAKARKGSKNPVSRPTMVIDVIKNSVISFCSVIAAINYTGLKETTAHRYLKEGSKHKRYSFQYI